jgi:hypothetical protein
MSWKDLSTKKKRFIIGGLVSIPYSIWTSIMVIGCINKPSLGCVYLLIFDFFASLVSTPFYLILGDPSNIVEYIIRVPLTFICNFLVLGLIVMLGGYIWDKIFHR